MSHSTGVQVGLLKTSFFFFLVVVVVVLHYCYKANTILLKQKEP